MADSFHFSVNIISRGKGKSAVASAAYISGEKIKNEWDGVTHDYTKKQGVNNNEKNRFRRSRGIHDQRVLRRLDRVQQNARSARRNLGGLHRRRRQKQHRFFQQISVRGFRGLVSRTDGQKNKSGVHPHRHQ